MASELGFPPKKRGRGTVRVRVREVQGPRQVGFHVSDGIEEQGVYGGAAARTSRLRVGWQKTVFRVSSLISLSLSPQIFTSKENGKVVWLV